MPGTASRGAEPRVVVHVLKGRAAKRAREMTGPTLLLGADAQCDVQLRSPDIAPKHCLISRQNGRVMATRLQADFPLLKNGAPIAEDDLADGDRLAVGCAVESALAVEATGFPPQDRRRLLGLLARFGLEVAWPPKVPV
ncbi:MAG TPA: FHA domain-containing protein, partial [Planctomycetia bacterium]|nr:FHA domain-containing protein [Planctomycetia bacterium]